MMMEDSDWNWNVSGVRTRGANRGCNLINVSNLNNVNNPKLNKLRVFSVSTKFDSPASIKFLKKYR